MILSDAKIRAEMERGRIIVRPFRADCLGTNSYDVHLGPFLSVYRGGALDARRVNPVREFRIPPAGYVLVPGQLYLGVTEEYTETHGYVPFLEGKSSLGRLGVDIHSTAGKGDEGFCNYWTLEMSVKIPVRIYAGMPVGQLIYFEISGRVDRSYSHKRSAKYRKVSPHPMPSRMHLNFRTRRPARAARKPAGEARDAAYAPGAGRPTK
ncbi:MAG: dCTP deaminase [Thermoplasmata archaeon]|jgi:dCTP deaminase|nr:dCTP deaminase [Thermoplasmata archaeon]